MSKYFDHQMLPMSVWPTTTKHPGLANGWEGAAWTALQYAKKNPELYWNHRTAGYVFKKLKRKAPMLPKKGYCSVMIGLSARPLIAALAGQNDRAFRKLLPDLIQSWSKSLSGSGLEADLMLGEAGALLAACEIETLIPGSIPIGIAKKIIVATQKNTLAQMKLLSQGHGIYIGLSHGLGGYLLALESAQAVFGKALTSSFRDKLIEIISGKRFQAERGAAVWPVWSNSEPFGIHGWCHGAPGIALGFLAGHAMTGRKDYLQIAEEALNAAFRYPSGHYSFCCGTTGKAQILIEAYRITGKHKWLDMSLKISKHIDQATSKHDQKNRSFHRGRVGRLYLEKRLKDPTLPLLGLGPVSVSGFFDQVKP